MVLNNLVGCFFLVFFIAHGKIKEFLYMYSKLLTLNGLQFWNN